MTPAVDLQHWRAGRAATLMRRGIARAVLGPEGWPAVFTPPDPTARWNGGVSGHLYVHLPFCRALCPHCPYNKVRFDRHLSLDYGRALARELAIHLERPDAPEVRSLYFGGGTPSMTPEHVAAVIDQVRPRLRPGAEVGVEAHPRDCVPSRLAELRDAGVTRISIGVESFDEAALRYLGRGYRPEQAGTALSAARSAGFECVDANLIFAVPGQASTAAVVDARRCLDAGVDQISAYPLFGFEHTRLGRGASAGVSDRERVQRQRSLSQACRDAGLERTSVWSFTRPGISPYSTVTHEDYVGFGAGAGSKVDGLFWFNTFSVPEYCRTDPPRPALVMQATPRMRRAHWLYWEYYQLRIGSSRYAELFGRDLAGDFGPLLRTAAMLGWLVGDPDGWRVTERGAIWGHKLQALFSLASIDTMWQRCQDDPWPQRVELR